MFRSWSRFFKSKFASPAPANQRDYIEWALECGKPSCPNCRKDYLISGPCGGGSINFACPTCLSRFNTGFLDYKTLFGFSQTGTVTQEQLRTLFRGEKLGA